MFLQYACVEFTDSLLSFCVLKNAELDALEAGMDFESNSVLSYLQPEKELDLES
jgi:hypothetical protein